MLLGKNARTTLLKKIPNENHPQILYWFFRRGDDSLAVFNRVMKMDSPFSTVFLTARDDCSFNEFGDMCDRVNKFSKKITETGLEFGIHFSPSQYETEKFNPQSCQCIVTDYEISLDEKGQASLSAEETHSRNGPALSSGVTAMWLFKKAGDGRFVSGSLVRSDSFFVQDLGNSALVSINAGEIFAGYSALVRVCHRFPSFDLFSDEFSQKLNEFCDRYNAAGIRTLPELDEFGYMSILPLWMIKPEDPFRSWLYSAGMDRACHEQYGVGLDLILLDAALFEEGKEERKVAAVNRYFELLRSGVIACERIYFNTLKKRFGSDAFAGFHNTAHNKLDNDEIWHTGITWWDIPRDYAQTDENMAWPVRLGIMLEREKDISYDMFYKKDADSIYKKALYDARFNGRIHYHAACDGSRWGKDLADEDFLRNIGPLERKIRLLNHFNPPMPRADMLIVFGFYQQLNPFPNSIPNAYNLRSGLGIIEKSRELWENGYICALTPDYLFGDGGITAEDGRFTFRGHTFNSLVLLYPEYMKPGAWDAVEVCLDAGVKVVVEGKATRDFNGCDISARYENLICKAISAEYSLQNIQKLPARQNTMPDGSIAKDGSILLSDTGFIPQMQRKPFAVEIDGHIYNGKYRAVAAFKGDGNGNLEKFACGGFDRLYRDGELIFDSGEICDIVWSMEADGNPSILICPDECENN